ncbi:MAG: FUSC family protein [Actinomycetota bacterium]
MTIPPSLPRERHGLQLRALVRRIARATVEVDWAPVSLVAALRCGVCTLVLLVYAVDHDKVGVLVPAVIGVLFVCLVDPLGPERTRIRVMAWFTVWAVLGAWAGGAVSESPAAYLVVGVVVAVLAGYAGAAGPVGQIVGLLTLVLFSVFAGTPTAMDAAVADALVLGAGAVGAALVIALPGLRRRARGPRTAFAQLARGLAHVRVLDPLSVGAALHATRERQFVELVAADRPAPQNREWFAALERGAHQARLAMLAMSARVPEDPDARATTVAFLDATRRCWRAAAATITWAPRRAGLVKARGDLEAARRGLEGADDPMRARLAAEIGAGLDTVTDALLGTWPRPARSERAPSAPARRWPATRHALAAHLRGNDPFARHAVRLGVTFGAAILLASVLDLSHPYWLPMTVAWIAKPTMGDTGVRVVARVAGTLVGVLVSGLVVGVIHAGPWVLVALSAASAVLAIAFVVANYAVAVVGITTFVFFVFTLAGENMESSLASRMLATVLAGVLVLAGALVWPTRGGVRVAASLGDYADALADYANAALTDGDADSREDLHQTVLTTRTQAVADLHAAEFEVGRPRVHPETAAGILESLHVATSQCLACELAGAQPEDRRAAPDVRVELVALRERLVTIDAGSAAPREHPRALDHPVHRSVRRAHEVLDADDVHQTRS